jgi:acetylornithine aminotransferase
VGEVLTGALRQGLAAEIASGTVKDLRGAGLMIGLELDRPCGVLLGRAAEAGLMISVTADSVIRLVPPLIMTADEARQVAAILVPLVRDFLAHG